MLGFAREGYPKFSFNLHDVAEYSTFPGFWKTMLRNIQHGLKEMKNSIFKAAISRRVASIAQASKSEIFCLTRLASAPKQ